MVFLTSTKDLHFSFMEAIRGGLCRIFKLGLFDIIYSNCSAKDGHMEYL